jgi:cysteine desulfurase
VPGPGVERETPIYLDYNATTPVDSAVADAMEPFLRSQFGNPSSAHAYGASARVAVERARAQVGRLLGCDPEEIVFTGSGSEATNLALKGLVFAALSRSSFHDLRLITSAVEHPATLEACRFLERLGCQITILPVDRHGIVDLDELRAALRQTTLAVSIMHANNEVGTLEPIEQIAEIVHENGALLHVDAAQSIGKIDVDVRGLGANLLTVAGHKLYAPKGIGALYIRKGLQLEPLVHGGGQEGQLRSGTESVPNIIGLGAACELASSSLPAATARLASLRDRLWQRLSESVGESVTLNGHPEQRLPNTLNVSFLGRAGSELLAELPAIAASTGSACHEGSTVVSPVLAAMGLSPQSIRGAIRLSVGRFTTQAEIGRAADLLTADARRVSAQTEPSARSSDPDEAPASSRSAGWGGISSSDPKPRRLLGGRGRHDYDHRASTQQRKAT